MTINYHKFLFYAVKKIKRKNKIDIIDNYTRALASIKLKKQGKLILPCYETGFNFNF